MSARVLTAGLIVGTGIFVLVAATWQHPEPVAEPAVEYQQPQWLSKEAAAQIFGPDGTLGPVFEGAALGASPPLPETRARIAAFAKAHNVDIELEIRDDELRAVTFAVTFGGCCGYEGVDVLALRLGRPRYSESCGGDKEWIDNWVINGDGVRVRLRANVNQLTARWEPMVTLPALLDQAEGLLGQRVATAKRAAGDRWREVDPYFHMIDVPFAFVSDPQWTATPSLRGRRDLGLLLQENAGEIVEVTFALPPLDDATQTLLDTRWGKPRFDPETSTRSYRKAGRVIELEPGRTVTIKRG